MTPPPETSAAGETLERIAKRIARKHVCGCHECKTDRAALETDILSALRNELERCEQIAHQEFFNATGYWNEKYLERCARQRSAQAIELAIREGK